MRDSAGSALLDRVGVLFAELDTDKSNTIDENEFVVLIQKLRSHYGFAVDKTVEVRVKVRIWPWGQSEDMALGFRLWSRLRVLVMG